jgi:hypothetical protein
MNTTLTTVLCAILLALPAMVGAQQDMLPKPGPPPLDPLNSNAPVQPKRANMVRYVLLMPNDKSSERVKPTERNPYGKSEEDARKVGFKGTNEENVIRDQLLKLRVSGGSFESDDTRIMLGDMALKKGEIVPPVIPEQSLNLRVNDITPTSIVLSWVEKKSTGLPARTVVIPVDLRPSVKYLLHGQPGPGDKTAIVKVSRGPAVIGQQFMSELSKVAADSETPAEKKKPLAKKSDDDDSETPALLPPLEETSTPKEPSEKKSVARQSPLPKLPADPSLPAPKESSTKKIATAPPAPPAAHPIAKPPVTGRNLTEPKIASIQASQLPLPEATAPPVPPAPPEELIQEKVASTPPLTPPAPLPPALAPTALPKVLAQKKPASVQPTLAELPAEPAKPKSTGTHSAIDAAFLQAAGPLRQALGFTAAPVEQASVTEKK